MRGRPLDGWDAHMVACETCGRRLRPCNLPRHALTHRLDARERIAVTGPSLDEQERIVAAYRRRGATLATVALEVHWSPTTVGRVLVAWGQPIRARGGRERYLPADEHLLTCQLYGMGFTIAEIAQRLGRADESIRQRLLRNGVPLRPRGFIQGTRRRRWPSRTEAT